MILSHKNMFNEMPFDKWFRTYIENRVVVQFASYILITYGNVKKNKKNDLAFVSIVNFVTTKGRSENEENEMSWPARGYKYSRDIQSSLS